MFSKSAKNLLLLVISLSLASCAGRIREGGQFRGSDLSHSSGRITLTWEEKSPLQSLIGNQDNYVLLASYSQKSGGNHVERLSASVQRAGRSLTFHLPESISRNPHGELCFSIVNVRSRRPVPVREAGHKFGSGGFFVPGVGNSYQQRFIIREATHRLEILGRKRNDLSVKLSTPNRFELRHGVLDFTGCDALSAPREFTSILKLDSTTSAAKRVCLHRVGETQAPRDTNPFIFLRKWIESIVQKGSQTGLNAAQITWAEKGLQLLRDLSENYASITDSSYKPEIGSVNDSIGVQLTPDATLDSYASSMIDAYSSCTIEVNQQLKALIKHQTLMKNSEGQRHRDATRFLRSTCRKEMQQKESIRGALKVAENSISTAESDIEFQRRKTLPRIPNGSIHANACAI